MKSAIWMLFILVLPSFCFSADLQGSNIKGFKFGYMDIEKNCEVVREGRESLSIECDGSHLKPVSRSCNGFISRGLGSAKLNCGGALWILNQRCNIEMRGPNKGEINCKL